jgi:UDP-glucuronate 4-epimerase
VTGAAGFVGVNLVRALAARGARVTALARRPPDEATRAFVAEHGERVAWTRGDVTDRDAMRRIVADGVGHVVHAAAVTATAEQERAATARVFDVNAGGTLNLLEAAREGEVRRFVLVSSGGLYGPAPPTPALNEETPLRAGNLYGIAKAASERLVGRYAELHGFTAAVGRLGTAYGPMERPSGSRHALSAIQRAILAFRAAAAEGREVRARGADLARDFLHIDDAADAFVRLVAAPSLAHDVYNVGAPRAATLAEALDALADATGRAWREAAPDEDADVAQDPSNARAAMDTARLEHDLGWRVRYGLADGARATLAWGEAWSGDHPAWFEGRR